MTLMKTLPLGGYVSTLAEESELLDSNSGCVPSELTCHGPGTCSERLSFVLSHVGLLGERKVRGQEAFGVVPDTMRAGAPCWLQL